MALRLFSVLLASPRVVDGIPVGDWFFAITSVCQGFWIGVDDFIVNSPISESIDRFGKNYLARFDYKQDRVSSFTVSVTPVAENTSLPLSCCPSNSRPLSSTQTILQLVVKCIYQIRYHLRKLCNTFSVMVWDCIYSKEVGVIRILNERDLRTRRMIYHLHYGLTNCTSMV